MDFEHDIDGLFETYKSLLPMKPEDEARLWEKFRLDWNYNSNRIEGNTLTYGETEALLILGTEPKRLQKDIREMKAHDLGITYLKNIAKGKRCISEADIRDLNRIILKENYFIETETADGNKTRKEIVPGNYKSLPNHVRLRGGGIHKFAEPHEVGNRMSRTVKSIRNYIQKQDKPLDEFLAEVHQYFIQTHPFDDGNGRVVRMLLNYICLKLGWPPVIIKNAKKADYLASLEQADKGDMSDLVLLMRAELIWSIGKSIKAARGEDINDPDDIDKEIDIFVREEQSIISDYEDEENKTNKHFVQMHLNTIRRLDNKFSKLSSLFDEYSKYPVWGDALGSMFRGPTHNDESEFFQKFSLRGLRGTSDRIDFVFILDRGGKKKFSTINVLVEVWVNGSSNINDRLHAPENLQAKSGVFSIDFAIQHQMNLSDLIQKFCDSIIRAVMLEIKHLKSTPPAT